MWELVWGTVCVGAQDSSASPYLPSGMDVKVPGLGGRTYGVCSGVCFEPQMFPDAPNQPGFPSARLNAGETGRARTVYEFVT